jgi:hypothetical protein
MSLEEELDPRFPMIGLYNDLHVNDKDRLAQARQLAERPADVADAFERTSRAIAGYENPEPFHPHRKEHTPTAGKLAATKDVALRLGPAGSRSHVNGAETAGLPPGALDFFYLDRELVTTRTTPAFRQPDVALPVQQLRLDVLLATEDGIPAIGEIKVKRDRDLFYGLIQALACISLLATEAQVERIRRQHDHHGKLSDAGGIRFDAMLISVAHTGGDTYLADLNKLARSFARDLMQQTSLTRVVRRVSHIEASLDREQLKLDARWGEAAAV